MALKNFTRSTQDLTKNQEQDEQNFSSTYVREIQPWPKDFDKPSQLYQLVSTHSQYPPLMQTRSWNLAVPFIEQRFSHTPSESIANNYTPTANNLQIRYLNKRNLKRAIHELPNVKNFKKPKLIRSRPMSPMQQHTIMNAVESEISRLIKEPSEVDLKRYYYYIEKGTDSRMIAPLEDEQFIKFYSHIAEKYISNSQLKNLSKSLNDEIKLSYEYAMRKAIVDYVLLNQEERVRVKIEWIPRSFHFKTIRAPIPWHEAYSDMSHWLLVNLHNVNIINVHLQQLWYDSYIKTRFISLEDLNNANLPLYPHDFEQYITAKCLKQRELLEKKWIPECAKLILELKDFWKHLVPQSEDESLDMPMRFFAAIASEMSNQLRDLVFDSLHEFVLFLEQYKDGNYFDTYNELGFVRKSALSIKLYADDPKIEFEPGFSKIEEMILNCISCIVESAKNLPRVEVELFPFSEYKKFYLRSVRPDEKLVEIYTQRAKQVLESNKVGPHKYLDVYKKYTEFLTLKAEQDVSAFLKDQHELDEFEMQIKNYTKIRDEITLSRLTAPLNFYCLESHDLHEDLRNRVGRLKERLVTYCVEQNRDANRILCKQYEEISDKVSKQPATTAELVEIVEFLSKSNETTIYQLLTKVGEAKERLMFLLDFSIMPIDDLKLNSQVFFWPELIIQKLETNQTRLQGIREKREEKLRDQIQRFDEKLKEMMKRVETYKQIGDRDLPDAAKHVNILNEISKTIEDYRNELEQINKEEQLFGWEQSEFPMLQNIVTLKDPYAKLWNTYYSFQQKDSQWLKGPFLGLNAEEIGEEVKSMWNTMHKLQKSFADAINPRKVADFTKHKIDKFRNYLPILQVICNPGLKDRHWKQV